MMPLASRVVVGFGLAACLAAVPAARQGAPISKLARDIAIQMLKQIRKDIERHYYDPKFRGIDVGARYAEAEAKLRAAPTATETSEILADFCRQFDDSHTRFYPPRRSVRAHYGWRMSIVGEAAIVTAVEEGSHAEAAGLRRGDRVQWLNRYRPARDNLWWLRYYYREVRPQARQRVAVVKPDGAGRVFDIESRVREVTVIQQDDVLREFLEEWGDFRADETKPVAPDILVWRMPGFAEPRRVEEVIRRAREFKTLVIDMRDNPGGRVDTLVALAGLTFDRPVHLGTFVSRDKTQKETSKPARSPFTGRIIALVNSESASAAEMYARVLQLEKRGTVLGDRTAGAVMTARFFQHQAGIGQVAFYAVSVTVGDVTMSDGGSLEKAGVAPDEVLLPSQDDLAAGRDPVLARAVALAGGSLTPEEAGALFDE
jgi:C-terminal processing protease CtpA/Prc